MLKLVINIDKIQLQSLEAFSFHVITLSYFCFFLRQWLLATGTPVDLDI